MHAAIILLGERGSGKTTIANLLGEALAPASILFIDASSDKALTHLLAPTPPPLTLADLLSQPQKQASGSREAIDWAFSDLTLPVGEEHELLTVGDLPAELTPDAQEKLRYGLSRLITTYDYVIIDDAHPALASLLPDEAIRPLYVLTPERLAQWTLPDVSMALHTPAILLNQYHQEPLPATLEAALLQSQVQLIGKLPHYSTPSECSRRMPDDFQDCLLRLNIPLHPA